jgi:membrane protein YdbS with pleckstrin-like domain
VPTETFRSKVDAGLVLVLGASAILALYAVGLAIRTGGMHWVAVLVSVVVSAGLPAWIFATTRYELSGEMLTVRSGPFRWHIPISEMQSVVSTRNPLSNPALSLDRLRLEYRQGRVVMISPRHKDAFRRALEARRSAWSLEP